MQLGNVVQYVSRNRYGTVPYMYTRQSNIYKQISNICANVFFIAMHVRISYILGSHGWENTKHWNENSYLPNLYRTHDRGLLTFLSMTCIAAKVSDVVSEECGWFRYRFKNWWKNFPEHKNKRWKQSRYGNKGKVAAIHETWYRTAPYQTYQIQWFKQENY